MKTVWWKIEALIPARNSLSGKPFWYPLDADGVPFRTADRGAANAAFRRACFYHEQCRLVRVTEEVSEQQDRFPEK